MAKDGTITVQVETKISEWIYHPLVFYPMFVLLHLPFTRPVTDWIIKKAIHVRVW